MFFYRENLHPHEDLLKLKWGISHLAFFTIPKEILVEVRKRELHAPSFF